MIAAILGKKLNMSLRFNQAGQRMPVTKIEAGPCIVMQVKTQEKDGYYAVQLGFGQEKRPKQTLLGRARKIGIDIPPKFLKEVRIKEEKDIIQVGQTVKVEDVFKPGDIVKISGVSKGKGFAGVVKRWGFAGGPKTHGQSDRERAPGSIGATTTPGRVFKGKKMAGRTGGDKVTVRGLKVIEVTPDRNLLIVKGSVPGPKNTLLLIQKMKEAKVQES